MNSNIISIERNDVLVSFPENTPNTAMILVHGRGGSAEDIFLALQHYVHLHQSIVLAPQADGGSWYPNRFLVPQKENEPYISASLSVIDKIIAYLYHEHKFDSKDIVLAGFSQGACLIAEYIKRNPITYKAISLMSGGLIGSDAEAAALSLSQDTSLNGTPIYIGCDNNDFHIPMARVLLSKQVFEQLGAVVYFEEYSNFGHAIHPNAIAFINNNL
jgi:phospholipase/carboxylesterase